MDSKGWIFFFSCLSLSNRISDCFQWTRNQQSTRAIDADLGSDVSLPCEFLLTSDEESAMQQFHLIYWTKEMPAGSTNWQGLASMTNLISNSEPKILYHDKNRILMKNNTLTIFSVKTEDDALYQCEVKSSFYTTPSVIKLNVLTQNKKGSTSKQHSTSSISNGASAGIGVGVTLLVMVVIILGAICFKTKSTRGRRTGSITSTNLAYIHRNSVNNMPEAYVGPAAFHNSELNINGAANNEYNTCSHAGKPVVGDTSF